MRIETIVASNLGRVSVKGVFTSPDTFAIEEAWMVPGDMPEWEAYFHKERRLTREEITDLASDEACRAEIHRNARECQREVDFGRGY